jgi:hypothetical protein
MAFDFHPIDSVAALIEQLPAAPQQQQSPATDWPASVNDADVRKWLRAVAERDRSGREARLIEDILWEFRDCIAMHATDLGHVSSSSHAIRLKSKDPVYTKQFPIPDEHLNTIKANVRDWLRDALVERARSPYNSPIFCVSKKGTTALRTVLDFRRLNDRSLDDRYTIRTIEDCIRMVGHAKSTVFTVIDLLCGFWQMPLQESSRPLTAFTIPGMGQYQWRMSPMGLRGCPASFQRMIEEGFSGLDYCSLAYIDDLLTHSPDFVAHLQHLRLCFARLRRLGLKINPRKCRFAATEVEYLGHTLTADGIRPGLDKTAAIRDAALPQDQTLVRSFLGLANFFRWYIPLFSKRAAPLFRLTSKHSVWKSGALPPDAAAAFKDLQKALTSRPVLAYPQRHGKLHLFVDAATGSAKEPDVSGMGAALLQDQADGRRRVIAFASRALLPHQKNYSPFLLELQAAVFAIDHFSLLLKGRSFVLWTDHKPLEAVPLAQTKTLNRLQEKLLEYTFETRYIAGNANLADYLSRSAPPSPVAAIIESPDTWRILQEADPECRRLRDAYEGRSDWPTAFPMARFVTIKDGLLGAALPARKGYVNEPGFRLIPPACKRLEIIREAHDSLLAGHGGTFRTEARIKRFFTWPRLAQDVASYVRACDTCQRAQYPNRPTRPPLQLPVPPRPNFRIHVDLYGPVRALDGSKKYVSVITCALTKIVRLKILDNKDAASVAEALIDWISIYMVPSVIVSDLGKEYINHVMAAMWDRLGVRHDKTSGFHPQTNSSAEVYNRQMASYLRRIIIDNELRTNDWQRFILPLMISSNTATHRTTKQSPFLTMFGYDPALPTWADGPLPLQDTVLDKAEPQVLKDLCRTQQLVRENARMNMLNEKRSLPASSQPASAPPLLPGDPIYIRRRGQHSGNNKLEAFWIPGVLVEVKPNHVARVVRLTGKRHRQMIISMDDVKRRILPLPPPPAGASPASCSPARAATPSAARPGALPPPPAGASPASASPARAATPSAAAPTSRPDKHSLARTTAPPRDGLSPAALPFGPQPAPHCTRSTKRLLENASNRSTQIDVVDALQESAEAPNSVALLALTSDALRILQRLSNWGCAHNEQLMSQFSQQTSLPPVPPLAHAAAPAPPLVAPPEPESMEELLLGDNVAADEDTIASSPESEADASGWLTWDDSAEMWTPDSSPQPPATPPSRTPHATPVTRRAAAPPPPPPGRLPDPRGQRYNRGSVLPRFLFPSRFMTGQLVSLRSPPPPAPIRSAHSQPSRGQFPHRARRGSRPPP